MVVFTFGYNTQEYSGRSSYFNFICSTPRVPPLLLTPKEDDKTLPPLHSKCLLLLRILIVGQVSQEEDKEERSNGFHSKSQLYSLNLSAAGSARSLT